MPLFAATVRITATPDQAGTAVREQLQDIDRLERAGRIRLAGALDRQDGFLVVFEAADVLDARKTVDRFPLVRSGLAAWSLRAFQVLSGP